jgi:hypothetical protein
MTPVNRSKASDPYVLPEIAYLDPDLDPPFHLLASNKMEKNISRTGWVLRALLVIAAFARAMTVRYFHWIAKLMNWTASQVCWEKYNAKLASNSNSAHLSSIFFDFNTGHLFSGIAFYHCELPKQ